MSWGTNCYKQMEIVCFMEKHFWSAIFETLSNPVKGIAAQGNAGNMRQLPKKTEKGKKSVKTRRFKPKPTSWQRAPQHLEEILKGLRRSPEERLIWPYPICGIGMGHESKHNFVYARALDKETNVPLSQDNPDSAISTTAHDCQKWFDSGPHISIFIPSPLIKKF